MIKKILKFLLKPYPLREIVKIYIRKFKIGTFEQRARIGALKEKSPYGYCVYHGAQTAKKLGLKRISVIEFGVAGGNGLVALEKHARVVEKLLSMKIDVYGFDLGDGLPTPIDYRDLPHFWKPGFYKMDVKQLKKRLGDAKLIFGDVGKTVETFFNDYNPSPVAAVMFDLDYYSATLAALKIFNNSDKFNLPRVFCYFDDIIGNETSLVSEYTGQRLAINEFNKNNEYKKFDVMHSLMVHEALESWYHKIRIFHDFKHKDYTAFLGR